jgi:hypothetical protein
MDCEDHAYYVTEGIGKDHHSASESIQLSVPETELLAHFGQVGSHRCSANYETNHTEWSER